MVKKMNAMTVEKTEKALVNLISETLKKQGRVSLKGWGTFSVEHQAQEHRQEKDGSVVLMPPSDVVRFTPER